ncbi:MAG: hypothetical protein OSB65_08090 [Roseibacillus sp.]|nr:hypothetical protein [Roseibacillus sp.]
MFSNHRPCKNRPPFFPVPVHDRNETQSQIPARLRDGMCLLLRPDNGVPLKMWSLIDEYSRQGLRIEVDRNLKGKETPDALAGAMAGRA